MNFCFAGLNAENIQDEARLDMIMDHVEEIREKYVKMIWENYVSLVMQKLVKN